jgi:hypothetical protein
MNYHYCHHIHYHALHSIDGFLGICKVADVHHRLSRAIEHDGEQIERWMIFENNRWKSSELNIMNKEKKLDLFFKQFDTIIDKISSIGNNTSLGPFPIWYVTLTCGCIYVYECMDIF